MGTVGTGFSMSLDGFIAGPNDEVDRVFQWMFGGENELQLKTGDHDIDLQVSEESAGHFEDMAQQTGAVLSGRRLFDVAGAWGGKHPLNVPVVVLTHTIPEEWAGKEAPFTFVTDSLESAVSKAKQIAGDKNVGVGGANIAQQCLKAGLLDEIAIDLVPVLLGEGIPLFRHLGIEPVDLECTSVVAAPGVTHLRYRIIKQEAS